MEKNQTKTGLTCLQLDTRKCRFEYDRLQTVKLREAKLKNAKLYWKMLKSCAGISNNNIPSDTSLYV